jgi:hypothetical protein
LHREEQKTENRQTAGTTQHHTLHNQQKTYLGDKVQASLSLLLLQLQGDASNGASLDALHQVGDEAGNLVSHSLGGDDGHLASHALVDVEVQGQSRVVLLDDHSRGLLDGLSTNTLLSLKRNRREEKRREYIDATMMSKMVAA